MIEQFREAIRSAGLEPPDVIEADGKLRRFASNGNRGDNAGWYVLHGDGIPAGSFGDWRTGVSESWRADIGRTLTPAEDRAHRAKVEAMRHEREAEEVRRKADAASKAAAIWQAAEPALDDHPYLARKRVKAHGARLHDGALVIPMRDVGGLLHSLQFIGPDGVKRFLTGGRVAGCYCSIGNPKGAAALCIAEGFATGATIYEATGYPVAVAFNTGNLEPVARALRIKFPDLQLILCADDDTATDGNPGLTKATAAALAVSGKLAVPDFGAARPDGFSDFNDMAALCGAEAVTRAIAEARTPVGKSENESRQAGNGQGNGQSGAAGSDDPIAALVSLLDDLNDQTPPIKVEDALRSLALALNGADPLRRATVREAALRKLEKIGISAPARLLDAALGNGQVETEQQQGRPVLFDDPEPWLEPVDGAGLFDDLVDTLKRFVVFPSHAAEAVALWILHAHTLEAFSISPLLTANSATKRAGKTLLLELVSLLVPRRLFASNITPAALFRAVEKFTPTLLIDEADTFLRDNDELKGILNASHRRASAFVVRSVGDEHEPTIFATWCAKAIALIGKLPDTLEDRSILISMKRKAPGEQIEKFRADRAASEFVSLKRKAARWAQDSLDALRKADPETPSTLNDRAADNWRPLLAIADLAGGEWPDRARAAALSLSGNVDEAGSSVLIQLLDDLRELFETREVDRVASSDVAEAFGAMEDRPWSEWRRGKPITQRQLAKLLAPLGIAPRKIRIGESTHQGYLLEQYIDSFTRYLPLSIRNTGTSQLDQVVTPETIRNTNGSVPDRKGGLSSGKQKDVPDVPDRKAVFGAKGDIWHDDL